MRPLVPLFALLGIASVVGLAWVASRAAEPVPPVRHTASHEPALLREAARMAQHRRVLVIHAEPGKEPRGAVHVSHETGGGWRLFPAAPPGAGWMQEALDGLASAVARDWTDDGKLAPEVIQALERFDVKLLVAENGKRSVAMEVPRTASRLQNRGGGIEVRYAQPIWKLLNERPAEHASKEVAWAKGLRVDKALFSDLRYGLWSLDATIEVLVEGDYLILLPAEGARVEVDGRRVEPGVSSLPFVLLHLPVGRSRVQVSFLEQGSRSWIAIGCAAGLVVALIGLLVLLRPDPRAELEARLADQADPAADPPAEA